MTLEKQQLVQNAALDGHYQIVCRNLFASLNSWYITLVDVEDWDWEVNEYRIFVGTREPPMIDEMNDYSVYYCGYNYYFIDNDGTVKKVVNVNFTEYGEQYTSFLKCAKIQVDYLYSNETGVIHVKDNFELDKNLKVQGEAVLNSDVEVKGDTLLSNVDVSESLNVYKDLKVKGDSEFTKNVKVLENLTVDGNLSLNGNLTSSGSISLEGEINTNSNIKGSSIFTDTITKLSGSGNVSISNGIEVSGNATIHENMKSKSLTVSENASISSASITNATISKDLNVSGYINGLKIRVV